MRLHIANKERSSWSLRPWLMLKMAGIEFEEELHLFLDDLAQQRQQWSSFSPNSKVPVLVDGDVTVWDSLAICLYLGERYPNIWPEDKAARIWAYSAAAEMHSGFPELRTQCDFRITPVEVPLVPDANLAAEVRRINELWQQGLTRFGGDFLAGNRFSAADAFYAPVALRLLNYGLLDYLSSDVAAYVKRIAALDAVQEWCREAR
ncbi:MAG: glutathione S-transferase [Neisseria sp.]|uniref:glutathione S-transferase family protein n=1 Tax=Neisseria sp. TaxID=192066 RepID=UPI0026DCC5FC|nr:glutathione S-transferase [Neisseria sp.]MDO4642064.1 glutathione S-transferase [Neisseria sp.]